jgi:flagellar biosynthesis protein FlhA
MKKTSGKTFSEQIHDYYNLTGDRAEENLDFIFSNGKKPDVVLSSMDEMAVALQYNRMEMQAPVIKVKGKNEFARKILSRAEKNKIPIVENKVLTRELYSQVSADDLLPEAFYERIAEIYARLYGELETKENDTKDNRPGNAETDHEKRDKKPPSVYIPDKLKLEIGSSLIPLVKYSHSPLVERIQSTRNRLLTEFGFEIPSVRIIDNPDLKENEYTIKVNGVEAGRACINMYLAINAKNSPKKIAGEKTRDPAFGLSALWIYENEIKKAKKAGFGVYDPVTVILTHISKIYKRFSTELTGLDEIQGFIDCVKEEYPVVVKELLKHYFVLDIKKVIHGLLAENISIKNIITIFETLSDYGEKFSHDHDFLIEKVRQRLKRQICSQYLDGEKTLRVLTLEPAMEHKIIEAGLETPDGRISCLESADYYLWIRELSKNISKMEQAGFPPVVLCSEMARRLVKHSTKREFPDLAVLSVLEIPEDINVECVGTINSAKE